MDDILFGILAIAIGLSLCLWGQWALRLMLAIWGAFVGFAVGAGLIDAITDQGFLASTLGWVSGVVLAVVFAALAYLYFVVSIALSMAAMGFVIGGTISAALGATSSWLIVLVGAACGIALAALAIMADLPQIILIALSSLTGATVFTSGLMLVFGVLDSDALIAGDAGPADHQWWYILFIMVALVGIVVQARQASSLRAPIRENWA